MDRSFGMGVKMKTTLSSTDSLHNHRKSIGSRKSARMSMSRQNSIVNFPTSNFRTDILIQEQVIIVFLLHVLLLPLLLQFSNFILNKISIFTIFRVFLSRKNALKTFKLNLKPG